MSAVAELRFGFGVTAFTAVDAQSATQGKVVKGAPTPPVVAALKTQKGETRKPYRADVNDEERAFVAPCFALLTEDAPQWDYRLRGRSMPCAGLGPAEKWDNAVSYIAVHDPIESLKKRCLTKLSSPRDSVVLQALGEESRKRSSLLKNRAVR